MPGGGLGRYHPRHKMKHALKHEKGFEKGKLKREVSLVDSVAYGVGVIIGAGIFALIGPAAGLAGNALWVSFLVAAAIASLTCLSYAELSSMYPKCAAEYVYVKNSMRSNTLAFVIGWISIVTVIISVAAVALGFGGYFHSVFAGVPVVAAAAALIVIMSAMNFYGISASAKLNMIFTVLELLGLFVVIFLGLPHIGSVNLMDFSYGFSGIFGAAALIFFAYLGFEELANIAEETKDAIHTIPKALIISIIVTTIVYMLIAVTVVSVVPPEELSQSSSPLSLVAERSLAGNGLANGIAIDGKMISLFITIMALFATSGTVLILLIVSSRMIYGMAEDGSLPGFWKKINEKHGTPHVAAFTAMLVALAFVTLANISKVANITDFGAFIIFATVNLAVIYLRFRASNATRPYKVPLNIGRMPVLALLGFLFSAYMLTHFELSVWLIGALIILSGLAFYDYWQKTR